MSSIPIVDVGRPDFRDAFVNACHDIGFACLTGHGITQSTFDGMRHLLRRLFAVDQSVKQRYTITRDNYRGFIPLGFFTPNRAEVNGIGPDWYEGFKLHWQCPPDHEVMARCNLYGGNRWPDAAELADMEATVQAYWAECDRVADLLLDVVAASLDVDAADLASWHSAPLTNMTLLHYPPTPPSTDGEDVGEGSGIHPHKDTNVLTLLHPDPVGGLEVRSPDGRWLSPEGPPDALVVNVGEMLELWSGGAFKATPHRVVNRSGRDRYAFPYFLAPNHDVVVAPLVADPEGRFVDKTMDVGELSAEVWRTNWPDEVPISGNDLGALDRQD